MLELDLHNKDRRKSDFDPVSDLYTKHLCDETSKNDDAINFMTTNDIGKSSMHNYLLFMKRLSSHETTILTSVLNSLLN